MGGQVGEGGTLQTDAAQLYLFVPIPAKAKKLGLLSIYIFSLMYKHLGRNPGIICQPVPINTVQYVQCVTVYVILCIQSCPILRE